MLIPLVWGGANSLTKPCIKLCAKQISPFAASHRGRLLQKCKQIRFKPQPDTCLSQSFWKMDAELLRQKFTHYISSSSKVSRRLHLRSSQGRGRIPVPPLTQRPEEPVSLLKCTVRRFAPGPAIPSSLNLFTLDFPSFLSCWKMEQSLNVGKYRKEHLVPPP